VVETGRMGGRETVAGSVVNERLLQGKRVRHYQRRKAHLRCALPVQRFRTPPADHLPRGPQL
jgi:hypothetical protein